MKDVKGALVFADALTKTVPPLRLAIVAFRKHHVLQFHGHTAPSGTFVEFKLSDCDGDMGMGRIARVDATSVEVSMFRCLREQGCQYITYKVHVAIPAKKLLPVTDSKPQ
jgi:hypothetical protein